MKNILKLALLLIPTTLIAQAPQIPLTGNIGSGYNGPLINSPAVVFATDADHTMIYPEMSGSGGTIIVTSTPSLTATRNLIAPNTGIFNWVVRNNTTGGQSINVKVAGGTGVSIANGDSSVVMCDTVNCYVPGGQNVTQFLAPTASWPSWLVPTVTNPYTAPSLAVTAAYTPLSAVTATAPVDCTTSGSSVNCSMQDSTVTPGTYLNVAFTVSAKGLITAAGPPFSASFGCTQCGTYEIGYSGITAASGAISYANPSVPTSASVSDGTNTDTLSTPFTSWVLSHPYTSNTTFTLTTLGNGQTVTQSNGIAFVPRSYGGTGSGGATGATASGTSAALVGASGTLTNIGLGSSCAGQSFTATTSGTQYVYYLSPCNVSNPGGGSFTIPGPTVFPMNAPTSFTFTGQYGGTWGGYLYQSVNTYVSGTSYTIGVGN